MDVVICGAGVGGLALAVGLHADGHRVRVLEAGPGPRTDGAAVTIFSNGAAALAGLGAPLAADAGGSIERLLFRTADGARLFDSDLRRMRRRTGFPVATVPRRRLIADLVGRLPDGLVRFGRPVTGVEFDGAAVTVAAGGETVAADVVVGADGYRSVVRRDVLGGPPARDCGWTSWQGLTPVLPELTAGTTGLCVVGPAGLVGLMPAGDGLLQWWFDVPGERPDPARVSITQWLRTGFAGYAEPVPALLAAIADADVGCYPHVLHEVPAAWGRGPTTLLGDAAHAFPPSQAQGANQALEDAWVLRAALRRPDDPVVALRAYERLRGPRVRRVSRMAASEATNRPPNAPTRLAVRLMPRALAGTAYLALLRRFSSVLNDEHP